MFMGDLQPQIKSNKHEKTKNEIAFHIIKRGVDIQVLRDEILVQLARQVSQNLNVIIKFNILISPFFRQLKIPIQSHFHWD